ncbi:MAG: hypothetical protein DRP78_04190, partial [Candidatus Omnitrophota bacterium]
VYAAETFLKPKLDTIKTLKLADTDQIKQFLRHLSLPKEIGAIKETYVPKKNSKQLILNIQDIHCNYEAQKHIADILKHLVQTYQLKLISVEGGSGKIDTTFYQQLPDEKVKEQVADYFLKEARINGTEYFAITTKADIALYGAEDPKFYDKDLNAYLKSLDKRKKILSDIAVLENNLNILKNKIYNKRLIDLDNHIVAYENGSFLFEDYVLYLSTLYPEKKFQREFQEVSNLVKSIRMKAGLDLDKAEKERKELIDYLTKNLTKFELEGFLKITLDYKAKTVDALVYNNKLKQIYTKMNAKNKTFSRSWPDLEKYIEYSNQYNQLDNFELFKQIDKLVERIKNKFYTTYPQKKLDHFLRIVRMSRSLFSAKLLNRDLTYVHKYRADFNSRKLTKFIERQSKRLKLNLPIPKDLSDIEKTLPVLEKFYQVATHRNNILASNTLNSMKSEKQCIGILVCGGFHTQGITEYLKDKKIGYIVVLPKVEDLEETPEDDQRYINALKGKKTPFEEQLEKEEKIAQQKEKEK